MFRLGYIITEMLLYILNETNTWLYKIGHTKSKTVTHRIKQLQTGNSNKIEAVWIFEHDKANHIEKMLHRNLSHIRKEGEWFTMEDISIDEIKERTYRFAEIIELLK